MPGPIMPISTFIASASTECSTLPPRAGSSSISPPGWMSKPSSQCRSACAGARSALILTPLELLDRIAALVLPPRVHRHRYFGVLAPNAPLRAAVTALAPVRPSCATGARGGGPEAPAQRGKTRPRQHTTTPSPPSARPRQPLIRCLSRHLVGLDFLSVQAAFL